MSEHKKSYQRFSIAQRIEHFVLILSFTTLGLTGIAQKYSLWPISQAFIAALGGIESTRIIHRTAAIVYVLEAVYHALVLAYKLFVLRVEASLLPGIIDVKNAFEAVLYNLRLSKKAPKMPRYNFGEKLEYWAMMWGTVLMGLTGFMLWNPIQTASILPGQFIPAAKAAHGGEAVLAVLAILLWHFYNVHIKHFSKAMFTGKLNHHEMEEEHGDELARIQKGTASRPAPDAATIRRRMTVFLPISLAFIGVSGFILFQFLAGEQTALDTYPPAVPNGEIFVQPTSTPTSQPTATPAPVNQIESSITWDNQIGDLFASQCGECHGTEGGLNLATYANLMAGARSGVVIVPGNADQSLLVKVLSQGEHRQRLDSEQLSSVTEWIQAGAPEK